MDGEQKRHFFSLRSHGRHEKERKLKFSTDQQNRCNFRSPFCRSSVLQHNPETICKAEQKNEQQSSRLIKFLARMARNTCGWVLQEGLELRPPRNTSAIPRGGICNVTQPVISAAATKNMNLETNTHIFLLTRETVQHADAQIYKVKIHKHDKNT